VHVTENSLRPATKSNRKQRKNFEYQNSRFNYYSESK